MTIAEIRARLHRAHAETGSTGRFSITFYEPPSGICSVMRWFCQEDSSAERCEEIGHGTIEECLDALDRYVAAFRTASSGPLPESGCGRNAAGSGR